ncbi:MAG: hypothetical protein KQH53_11365 [Desulfarculaceae bacterium]|nr:hypothetical protein [Desulfarculaceae bacterium]
MPGPRVYILACLMALGLLAAAAPALAAGPNEPNSVEDIQKQLDGLSIIYRGDHPEVIRLKEHLRKLKANQAKKKALERAQDPKQAPAIGEEFRSSQSFE